MLKKANLSKNMQTSVGVAKKNEVISSNGFNKTNKTLSKSQNTKNFIILSNIDANIKNTEIFIFKTSTTFTQLRQTFIKALMLQNLDLECYIRIETNISGYIIGEVLSLLILDSRKWYLITYFLRKMILSKMRYKTHNSKLLAIFKTFKTYCHYLKSYKH